MYSGSLPLMWEHESGLLPKGDGVCVRQDWAGLDRLISQTPSQTAGSLAEGRRYPRTEDAV